MENRNFKKKIILALTPLLGLSMLVLFSTLPVFLNGSNSDESNMSSLQGEYSTEQKSDTPSHEPVYISVLKFIMNCNPFQKETQQ
jgi:hypothetical protein